MNNIYLEKIASIKGAESVASYLARGGKIKKIPKKKGSTRRDASPSQAEPGISRAEKLVRRYEQR